MTIRPKKYTLAALGTAFLAMIGIAAGESTYFKISKNMNLFANVYEEVNRSYVDEVQPAELMASALKGMLKNLDPYTNYISEAQIESARLEMAGGVGDVGMTLVKKGERVFVEQVLADAAAAKAGIRAGDEILSIEGKALQGKTLQELNLALIGQPNTVLKLEIQPLSGNKTQNYELLRKELEPKSVVFSKMVNDSVGYIRLTSFTQKCGSEVAAALQKFKDDEKNFKYLIFDLRDNGGGLLAEAILTGNIFLPKGSMVVSTKGKIEEWDKQYAAPNNPIDGDVPVAVLINGKSASASEIVSGAIQDFDRGVLIGQRSYGKGLVQQTRDIGDTGYKAKLKVTVAKYYLPSGRCIQAVDYSGRYSDAGAKSIPDSLCNVFYTTNKRKVLDNSGVLPDIILEKPHQSEVLVFLEKEMLLFEFANQYTLQHDSIAPVHQFKVTDKDFNDFLSFVKNKKLGFQSSSDSLITRLYASTETEHYDATVQNDLKKLEEKLYQLRLQEMSDSKADIQQWLQHELIRRYYFQQGYIEATLKDDPYVQEALTLFGDMPRYRTILQEK
ncbi:MAG: S41 family peptidase [Sphingobacteriales bacterium]|nr:S41 family peptidase [Sphingobacteriales bacterium]